MVSVWFCSVGQVTWTCCPTIAGGSAGAAWRTTSCSSTKTEMTWRAILPRFPSKVARWAQVSTTSTALLSACFATDRRWPCWRWAVVVAPDTLNDLFYRSEQSFRGKCYPSRHPLLKRWVIGWGFCWLRLGPPLTRPPCTTTTLMWRPPPMSSSWLSSHSGEVEINGSSQPELGWTIFLDERVFLDGKN